jgi:ATP-binding cassette subfamily B protein
VSAALREMAWPAAKLGEALAVLGRDAGFMRTAEAPAPPPAALASADALGRWVEAAAGWLGFEAEAVEARHGEIGGLLRSAAPALLRVAQDGEERFLAVSGRSGRAVALLAPDLETRRVRADAVEAALAGGIEAKLAPEIDRLVAAARISGRRAARVRRGIARARLAGRTAAQGWILRPAPGSSFARQLAAARCTRRIAWVLAAHALQYLLFLLSWWMIGRGALDGRIDRGWLWAWALVVLTLVPLRALASALAGLAAIDGGALLRVRLLAGALKLAPEEVRTQGAGQLLGRVVESQALEGLALGGGILGLTAVLELALAAAVLASGAAGAAHALLLAAWTALTLALGRRYLDRRERWTEARLGLTYDLVERMVGHRTRLAQEAPERRHEGEDDAVERAIELARSMDASAARLLALAPRGWLVVGMIGLAPAFVGRGAAATALAVSVGGVLLAWQAFERLAASLSQLVGAAIAWRVVGPLFRAAARWEAPGSPGFAVGGEDGAGPAPEPLIEVRDLVFRYAERAEPVLRRVDLAIRAGDRVLLEGPSGGGKSTLAALLAGLRAPEAGFLLLGGLDRHALGAGGWRRRVVAAPQFHENHVLPGTFAFNLLMGRGWPPRAADLAEAEAIARELGLGPLLERMPAGMQQTVGETGWQLSHGERSRIFIARALLQRADLVLLDESFAALDPDTLRQALGCVLARAPALVVIAHP